MEGERVRQLVEETCQDAETIVIATLIIYGQVTVSFQTNFFNQVHLKMFFQTILYYCLPYYLEGMGDVSAIKINYINFILCNFIVQTIITREKLFTFV